MKDVQLNKSLDPKQMIKFKAINLHNKWPNIGNKFKGIFPER